MGLYTDTRVQVWTIGYSAEQVFHGEAKVTTHAQSLIVQLGEPAPPGLSVEDQLLRLIFVPGTRSKDPSIHLARIALPYQIRDSVLTFSGERFEHVYGGAWKDWKPGCDAARLLVSSIEDRMQAGAQDILATKKEIGRRSMPWLLYMYSQKFREQYKSEGDGAQLYKANLCFTLKPEEWGQKGKES